MADLDVQPKKKASFLPWLLLGLGVIALLFFLTRDKDDDADNRRTTETGNYNSSSSNAAAASAWDIDWNAPRATYDEVTAKDIDVRGTDAYAIYGLGEDILFDTDKSTLRSGAEENLQQIAQSIKKRFEGGEVRVYGHTDAQGSAGHNQQLSEERARTVENWLAAHGIAKDRISVQGVGEQKPASTNSTEEGRQENRRVQIVARK